MGHPLVLLSVALFFYYILLEEKTGPPMYFLLPLLAPPELRSVVSTGVAHALLSRFPVHVRFSRSLPLQFMLDMI